MAIIDLQINTTVILSLVFTLHCRINYTILLLQNMVKNIPLRILIRYSDKVKVYSCSSIERRYAIQKEEISRILRAKRKIQSNQNNCKYMHFCYISECIQF